MNILSSWGPDLLADVAEPTDAELIAIEAEWPAIEADLIVLDVQLAEAAARHAIDTTVQRQTRRRTRRVLVKAVAS